MKKQSLVKNYFYTVSYQIIHVIFPLITAPYIARVLGAENIGIYSYTFSIVTYFIIFGSLGTALYGQREIAYLQDDKTKYSKCFWEIEILRAITICISLVFFCLIFIVRENAYRIFYAILALELLNSVFDISWFFQGQEDFKLVTQKNFFVKIFGMVFLFVFVRSKDDLVTYFWITVLTNFLGNGLVLFSLRKYLSFVKLKELNVFKHLKPALALFIPQIAIQIYTVLDKTMLGFLIDDKSEVGYYDEAQRVVKMLLGLVASLGTVMMPRIANKFEKKEQAVIQDYMVNSLTFIAMISLPVIFGLFVVTDEFVPLFFGPGFESVSLLIKVISPILLFIGFSGVIGTQYMLPTKQHKRFTTSVIIGALVNFTFNLLLIPKHGALGASLGTLIAEGSVTVTQIIMMRKDIRFAAVVKPFCKYLCFSALMFACCLSVSVLPINNVWISVGLKIVTGSAVYFECLLLTKDALVDKIYQKIVQMLHIKFALKRLMTCVFAVYLAVYATALVITMLI